MMWWIWTIIGIYVAGFVVVFGFHLVALQMVTPGLAFLRAVFWFLLWTGWFQGTPLPMD